MPDLIRHPPFFSFREVEEERSRISSGMTMSPAAFFVACGLKPVFRSGGA
jgi:hypothetical protein